MKLRNHLMLWLALTSVLPLVVLMVAGTHFQQRSFLGAVDAEMQSELNRLTTKLGEQVQTQRSLLESLAEAPPLTRFGAAYSDTRDSGSLDPDYLKSRHHLQALLENMQRLVPTDVVFRVLDEAGNTLLKSSFGETQSAVFEGLTPYPLREMEADSRLKTLLDSLPNVEISHRSLSGLIRRESVSLLPDAIRPVHISLDNRIYLIFSHRGEQFDRLLDLSPRLRNAELALLSTESIVSAQPHLLYDDAREIKFADDSSLREAESRLTPARHTIIASDIYELTDPDRRVYYIDHLPYPDSFETWRLFGRLDRSNLLERFNRIRWITAIAALLLLAGITALAWYGSRRIAEPICRLAANIRAYASDESLLPDTPTLSSEVRNLQGAFQQMIKRLERSRSRRHEAEKRMLEAKKLASIGEMAAGIGHELNNPLNNIISLTKLMKSEVEGAPELEGDLDSLREEALRASKIVAGILNFAREVKPRPEWFDAIEWLKNCEQRVADTAHAHDLILQLETPLSLQIYGDAGQLQQVVINLLTNAIQASPAGSSIQIIMTAAEEISLIINDQGEGISDADAERIFEPFFTTKQVGEGSGLGLAISLGIVESHGGTLTLENHPEGGCIAEIRLPLSPDS